MPQHPSFALGRRGMLAAGGAWSVLLALQGQPANGQAVSAAELRQKLSLAP